MTLLLTTKIKIIKIFTNEDKSNNYILQASTPTRDFIFTYHKGSAHKKMLRITEKEKYEILYNLFKDASDFQAYKRNEFNEVFNYVTSDVYYKCGITYKQLKYLYQRDYNKIKQLILNIGE